tara:strand:- start:1070 stop:1912 length:843 start_codon:yes stop_codon:yes gene_type:complete
MALKKSISKFVINCEELFNIRNSSSLKIIDCRWYLNKPKKGGLEYKKSHIENSIYFDIEKLSNNFCNLPHMFPLEEQIRSFLEKNGININNEIIIYDQEGFFCSGRVWFIFKVCGFKKIRILDGGFAKWIKLNLPITNKIKKAEKSKFIFDSFESKKIVNKEELKKIIIKKDCNTKIIDARPRSRFLGIEKEPRPNLKKGRVKSSINIPFRVITNNMLIRDLHELKHLIFNQNKIKKTDIIVCYCGSGVTACNIIFVLTLLGIKNVKLYDGSWAEWGKIK